MLKRLTGWLVIALGVFLILDTILAVIPGKRYMFWGLEYTPDQYHSFIENVADYSPAVLLGMKLGEGVIGFMLFRLARKIIPRSVIDRTLHEDSGRTKVAA